jgi:hypothetical protein
MRAMRLCAFLAVWVAPACGSLAGSDYLGGPLITLNGSFASTGGPTATAPEPMGGVGLLWQDAVGPGGPGVAATLLPVAIEFPAAFSVAVPVPPPDAARFELAGDELAEAYVYLVADATAAQPQPEGLDRGHALVWTATDVADGSLAADYLGGAVTAGYHLRTFAATATPGTAQQQLIARCDSSGAIAAACSARRAYQLAPAGDTDPLVIEVAAP